MSFKTSITPPPVHNVLKPIVVTPGWGEVPKEVMHLKDDHNFRQFEIVSLPSTMEVKQNIYFTAKQN